MKTIKYIIISVLFICLSLLTNAQEVNNTLYFLKNNPQNKYLNPAIQRNYKSYSTFPLLGKIYINYSNTGFAYNDIIHKGSGNLSDSLIIDLDKFYNTIKKNNYILVSSEISYLSFGAAQGKSFVTFDFTNKSDFRLGFDKIFLGYFINGNSMYRGSNYDLGSISLNMLSYNEIAFGVSRAINDRLTIGVRAKLLMGIANINTEKSTFNIFTSETGDKLVINSEYLIRASMPVNYKTDENGYIDDFEIKDDISPAGIVLNTNNLGYAFDFGAFYKISDRITVSAAAIDLGIINWNDNATILKQKTSYTFNGVDLSNSLDDTSADYKPIEDLFNDISDSITNQLKPTYTDQKYRTNLTGKLMISGTYNVNNWLSGGVLGRTDIYKGKWYPSLTVSANTYVLNGFSTAITYTIGNGSFNNLGLGLSTRLGAFQLYIVTDNILAPVIPHKTRNMNFAAGVNFVFGSTKEDEISRREKFVDDIDIDTEPETELIVRDTILKSTPVIDTTLLNDNSQYTIPKTDSLNNTAIQDSTKIITLPENTVKYDTIIKPKETNKIKKKKKKRKKKKKTEEGESSNYFKRIEATKDD
jgi:hypothetical protein